MVSIFGAVLLGTLLSIFKLVKFFILDLFILRV